MKNRRSRIALVLTVAAALIVAVFYSKIHPPVSTAHPAASLVEAVPATISPTQL